MTDTLTLGAKSASSRRIARTRAGSVIPGALAKALAVLRARRIGDAHASGLVNHEYDFDRKARGVGHRRAHPAFEGALVVSVRELTGDRLYLSVGASEKENHGEHGTRRG